MFILLLAASLVAVAIHALLLKERTMRRIGEIAMLYILAGYCGVDGPDAYGGLGLGKTVAARILEYLSMNGSFAVTLGVTSGIGQVGLSWFGTDCVVEGVAR